MKSLLNWKEVVGLSQKDQSSDFERVRGSDYEESEVLISFYSSKFDDRDPSTLEDFLETQLGDRITESQGSIAEPLEQEESVDAFYNLDNGAQLDVYTKGEENDDFYMELHYDEECEEFMEDVRSKLRIWSDPDTDSDGLFSIEEGVGYTTPAEHQKGEEYETVEPVIGIEDRLRERFASEDDLNVLRKPPDDDLYAGQKKPKTATLEDGTEYYEEVTFEVSDPGDEFSQMEAELHITLQKTRKGDSEIRFMVEWDDRESEPLADELYDIVHTKYEELDLEKEDEEIDQLVEEVDVSMKDIGGLDDLKQTLLKDIVLPMKHSDEYEEAGIEISNGILFHGPPGTGKTYTAKAIANEIDGGFYKIDDEILEKYVGETEENLREIVEEAHENGPSIIYIDEIDSLLSQREEANKQHEQSKTGTLLRLMDGFEPSDGVTFIAATNNPDKIDSALLRSGRLDKEIEVPLPDKEGRREILDKKISEYEAEGAEFESVDLEELASEAEGASGADLDNWVRDTIRDSVLPDKIDFEAWLNDEIDEFVIDDGPVDLDDFLETKEELDFLEERTKESYEGPDWQYQ